ncbi:helix-turn-helix transcriptional regulator [Ensifer sp. BR816]|uniref:AraC family transcriptional regulator n=1 Tax=Rhizobium sp. (strain BR816) TaxID=1057002 RepID=UPI0003A9B53C|nr:helix-turn-helix transcriptional regulator [Ensifer sp. BR816]
MDHDPTISVANATPDILDDGDEALGDPRVIFRWHHYPSAHVVSRHLHARVQLVCVFAGVVVVETDDGRFMTPPGHGLVVPAGLPHSHIVLSDVAMVSVHLNPAEAVGRQEPFVFEVTDLARSLLLEAVKLSEAAIANTRSCLVQELLIEEITNLEEKHLVLSFPSDVRLAGLCRGFLEAPTPNDHIDDWAGKLGMSRRAFTRFFRRETGVSFLKWRQQAIVFSSLPRLSVGEPVTSVALEAGYGNIGAFTTMFRRVMGLPPKQYAEKGKSFAKRDVEPEA